MTKFCCVLGLLLVCSTACSEELLFEESFETGLSPRWRVEGLASSEYRVRNGRLELRLQPAIKGPVKAMLRVDLPFTTADSVTASAEVTPVSGPLPRGGVTGLYFVDANGLNSGMRKTNIEGFFVSAPGEVDFIGKPGEEGDPGRYTVKYWPADDHQGPCG